MLWRLERLLWLLTFIIRRNIKGILRLKFGVPLFLWFQVAVNSILMVWSLNSSRAPQMINYSTFCTAYPKRSSSAVWPWTWKRLLLTLPKAEVAGYGSWRAYNDCVTKSSQTGPSYCSLLLETQEDGTIGLSRRVLNGLSFRHHRRSVCVLVSGIWYHETATTGFGDNMGNLFHIQSRAAPGVRLEVIVLKAKVSNYLLHSRGIETP